MRQVFSSPRLENVERVAELLREQGIEVRVTDINLYHLKMIAPKRRQARRDLYNHLDPERKLQAIGYDYLTDEEGLELENIPVHRFYDPPFVEDHGLWMPEIPGN